MRAHLTDRYHRRCRDRAGVVGDVQELGLDLGHRARRRVAEAVRRVEVVELDLRVQADPNRRGEAMRSSSEAGEKTTTAAIRPRPRSSPPRAIVRRGTPARSGRALERERRAATTAGTDPPAPATHTCRPRHLARVGSSCVTRAPACGPCRSHQAHHEDRHRTESEHDPVARRSRMWFHHPDHAHRTEGRQGDRDRNCDHRTDGECDAGLGPRRGHALPAGGPDRGPRPVARRLDLQATRQGLHHDHQAEQPDDRGEDAECEHVGIGGLPHLFRDGGHVWNAIDSSGASAWTRRVNASTSAPGLSFTIAPQ